MTSPISLRPTHAVSRASSCWFAEDSEPWLDVVGATRLGWIEMTYAASYLDSLCRPVLAFTHRGRPERRCLPAALCGVATALVHIPAGATDLRICPSDRRGPFEFVLRSWTPLPAWRVAGRGLRRNPRRMLEWVGATLIGAEEEAAHSLRMALGDRAASQDGTRDALHGRDFDPDGLDQTRLGQGAGVHVRVIVRCSAREAATRWIEALDQDPYRKTSVRCLGSPGGATAQDPRLAWMRDGDPAVGLLDDLRQDDLVVCIAESNRLVAGALAILAEHATSGADILYGDRLLATHPGTPLLSPDWSDLTGGEPQWALHPVAMRVGLAARIWDGARAEDVCRPERVENWPTTERERRVHPIRRILTITPTTDKSPTPRRPPPARPVNVAGRRSASIVIPTRNRAGLLGACLESLRLTKGPGFEVIIVDNGSADPSALALLTRLAEQPDTTVIAEHGAFNFSALCNAGARRARGSTLVFLNNDIEIIEPDWLARLLDWTGHPTVGAVGARLIYPDGRLQHDGIALGLGGIAGHPDVGEPLDREALRPREVSAVTGACLAVDRQRFETVGGFDAVRLPVDLNDVDLCLRLAERNWRTVLADTVLVHHESASRGRALLPFKRYAAERSYFVDRWWRHMRADPFFHPALSLASLTKDIA